MLHVLSICHYKFHSNGELTAANEEKKGKTIKTSLLFIEIKNYKK
jgi:hypothetical protein